MKTGTLMRILCMLGVLSLFVRSSYASVRRARNEGTMNIPASNVLGNGNMIAGGLLSCSYASTGLRLDPGGSLAVGVADFMQVAGKMAFTNFTSLGSTEAHLQLTLPNNDQLRFLGVSLSGDLYLSTTMDTLTGSAIAGRPDYHAYLRPSLIADLDWIARYKTFPLKTYVALSMVDDQDLLYLYTQLALRLGVEWKMYQNSFSVDLGLGFYKENARKESKFAGDNAFLQERLWIEPAIRYRLFERFSLIAGIRALVVQRVKNIRPLQPTYIRISCGIQMPLLFRETNTEAIRTMLFIEGQKTMQPDSISSSIAKGTSVNTDSALDLDGIPADAANSNSEKESLKRREEIQQKMEEIERLLEDLE